MLVVLVTKERNVSSHRLELPKPVQQFSGWIMGSSDQYQSNSFPIQYGELDQTSVRLTVRLVDLFGF